MLIQTLVLLPHLSEQQVRVKHIQLSNIHVAVGPLLRRQLRTQLTYPYVTLKELKKKLLRNGHILMLKKTLVWNATHASEWYVDFLGFI